MKRILGLILVGYLVPVLAAAANFDLRELTSQSTLFHTEIEFDLTVYQSPNDSYKARQEKARTELEKYLTQDIERIRMLRTHLEVLKSRIQDMRSTGKKGNEIQQTQEKIKEHEFGLNFMIDRLRKHERAVANLNFESKNTLSFSGVNVMQLPEEVVAQINSPNSYFELVLKTSKPSWFGWSRKPLSGPTEMTLKLNDLNQVSVGPLNFSRCALF